MDPFQLDLRQASYRLWLFLGEAQAICAEVARSPLLPSVAENLHRVFLAKGALATTAIEGNTLTEDQVLRRLAGNLELPPSKEYLGQEIDNIIEACNLIAQQVLDGRPEKLCVEDVKQYNAFVLKNLPVDDEVVAGQIRDHGVNVGRYRGAPPEDCEYLLARLCEWLNAGLEEPQGYQVAFSLLRAIVAHVYIAWIHPFADGNGRTARLIEFQILLAAGVPTIAAHLLSNHYNQTRSEYYRQLDRTSKSETGLLAFIEYALQGFVDGLDEQIAAIRAQQLFVHWINYVHDCFRDRDRPADRRKRRLVLDLSEKQEPVPLSEIRHISPRIAEAYADKTQRTVRRDINELEEMGLLEKTPRGIRARRESMLAFLPLKLEDVSTRQADS